MSSPLPKPEETPAEERKYTWPSKLAPFIAAAVFGLAIWALSHALEGVYLHEVIAYLRELPASTMVATVLFTAGSYAMLTLYDWLGTRYANAPLPYRQLAPIAFSAFAVGHSAGVASLSGGAIRFRAYSLAGLNAVQIAVVITFVPVTFALGASALLGVTLVTDFVNSASVLPASHATLTTAGITLIALPILYVLWATLGPHEITLLRRRLRTPSGGIALGQVLVSIADLSMACAALYVLLPDSADISFLAFLGAFLLAMSAGVASNVPGGLGVFESALLLLLPSLAPTTLLAAIVAYRLFYYIAPLALAVMFIVWRELAVNQRLAMHRVTKISAQWAVKVAPQTLAIATFFSGASLLFGGVLPIGNTLFAHVIDFLPLPIIELSHLLGSALGLTLLVLARGLYRRLRGAYTMTLVLLAVAIVSTIFQGANAIHVGALCVVGLMIWLSREAFFRGGKLLDQTFSPRWLASILLVGVASSSLGVFAYQHVQYADDLWWKFATDADASRMLRGQLLVIIMATAFAFAHLLRGHPVSPLSDKTELQTVKTILAKADDADANVALLGDKRFLLHPSKEAFIMFQACGGSWVALGDPVGNTQHFEELCWSFREQCDQNNVRCVFYQVAEKHLPLYIDLGLAFLKLGEEAGVNLQAFSIEGSARADLRQAVNRGAREGLSFSVVPAAELPALMTQLKTVSDAWLNDKSVAEKGFSLGKFEPSYLAHFDCAVIRKDEEIVAFANIWPTANKRELSVDLMRYSNSAPKGVMDYLFTHMMLWGKEQGYQSFSLGMAPLAGMENHPLSPLWHKVGHTIFRFGDDFYNFEGLHDYKQKFDPEWTPRYLACKHGLGLPKVLVDVSVLIAGGVKGLFFK